MKKMRVGSWNVRHGLIKHEKELTMWMKEEKLDIAFAVEADTNMVKKEEDYQIEGYSTIIPKIEENQKVRILAFKSNKTDLIIKTRTDLMSSGFPSIGMEIQAKHTKNTLVFGFYREWTRIGFISDHEQCEILETLTAQMNAANSEGKLVIMLGDANMDGLKWDDEEYTHYRVATDMQNALKSNGMKAIEIGNTFLADKTRPDGTQIESALDHVYIQQEMMPNTKVTKGKLSATDHLPIIAELSMPGKQYTKPRKVYRRSWKKVSKNEWNTCLATQNWEDIGKTEDVEEMANIFNKNITTAQDTCAPCKWITIRSCYKDGISEDTKQLIKQRNKARQEVKLSGNERHIAHQKYKTLRNRVTSAIRYDTIKHNDKRVEEAENENEVWKIIKESTAQNGEKKWKLKEEDTIIEDENKIADIFNNYFKEKITKLKEGIDKEHVKEPLEKLKQKMASKNLKFNLKQVSEKTVEKALKSMNKKKSSDTDGLSQEKMIDGTEVLKIPLTRIINKSIETGQFPKAWKEAQVTPIQKKGDPKKRKITDQ